MKHWTQRQALDGVTVSPDSINIEMQAQRSSITTLDRTQIPTNLVDHNNTELNAIAQVWQDRSVGTGGEQSAARDTKTVSNGW